MSSSKRLCIVSIGVDYRHRQAYGVITVSPQIQVNGGTESDTEAPTVDVTSLSSSKFAQAV